MEPGPGPSHDGPIATPPAGVNYHPLVRHVARGLRRPGAAVAEGDGLLLATSGGADSLALLHAAATLAPRRGWRLRLTVAHVHHHLRGDAADADADAVARAAAELGLPYVRGDVDRKSTRLNSSHWW